MATCPSCSTRRADRLCGILQLDLCGPCCAELRRESAPCRSGCPHVANLTDSGSDRVRHVIRRHGSWLSARLRAFSGSEDAFAAALDLEESICVHASESPGLSDAEVLQALDHLAGVSEGAPVSVLSAGLGLWLQECMRAAWEQEPGDDHLPGLLLLGLFPPKWQGEVIRGIRAIVAAEAEGGGYLGPASSYFEDLRSAEGTLCRPRKTRGRPRSDAQGAELVESAD